MQRVEHMHQVFADYFVKATSQLGCNAKCVDTAVANKWKNFGEVMPKCGCGEGAWKVKTQKVNVLAATERVYGDLESLNQEDNNAVMSALIRIENNNIMM